MWCWRRLLRVLRTTRRSNQTILKEMNPKYSLEGLTLQLKLQYFGHPMPKYWHHLFLIGKVPDAGKDWGQEEKGAAEDEMVGWHYRLNGHWFEQIPGDAEGMGSLVCRSPWGHKESDTTAWPQNDDEILKSDVWSQLEVQGFKSQSEQHSFKAMCFMIFFFTFFHYPWINQVFSFYFFFSHSNLLHVHFYYIWD